MPGDYGVGGRAKSGMPGKKRSDSLSGYRQAQKAPPTGKRPPKKQPPTGKRPPKVQPPPRPKGPGRM